MKGRGAQRTAKCIFHSDKSPSLSINVEDGVYICHNPECGAKGDVFTFVMRVRSMTFPEAVRELGRRVGIDIDNPEHRPDSEDIARQQADLLARYQARERKEPEPERYVDEAIITAHHNQLMATESVVEALSEKRGLTRETMKTHTIGWDGGRYFIPIRNTEGRCLNIRRYRLGKGKPQDKMISWRQGFGQARLWPMEALDTDVVWLVEGEMDCLLGMQVGINAITTTGGAGTWKEAWNELFKGKTVYICYDRDEAGRVGSHHIAHQLLPYAKEIHIVQIPITEPVGADLTDYLHGHGHGKDDLRQLAKDAPVFTVEVSREEIEEEPVEIHLSEASEAEYYNKKIRTETVVIGKTMAPYYIPKRVVMNCSLPGIKMCERCPMAASGSIEQIFELRDEQVAQFIKITDVKRDQQVRKQFGIPTKCTYVKQEIKQAENLEECSVIPEVRRTTEKHAHVTRMGYFVGHGLQANRSYIMTGTMTPDPQTQQATLVIRSADESQSNIDVYQLSPEGKDELKKFQPDRPDSVHALWQKMDEVYADLEWATRIYQRRDLMLAVDLTYHSQLAFEFQGAMVARGWVEMLCIGDTRTGKSETVKQMLNHYGAGEITSGENSSLAGLIGGLHQVGTTWQLRWGRIPLNDRRLLVIDEAGNLATQHIGAMSSMRSSGVAEVTKVHSERTNARTRSIWIANPRSNQPLSTFPQGVLAVKELIGAPEDIARFDLVIPTASADVGSAVVNQPKERGLPKIYTPELCYQRVMWAWSRQRDPNDMAVDWVGNAERLVLKRAMEQGAKYQYAMEIPLVEPNEQRIKLARFAVSAAAMFFSTDEACQRVLVKEEHVEFVFQYLERMYSRRTMGFSDYARAKTRLFVLRHPEKIDLIIGRKDGADEQLYEGRQFTQRDLQEILDYDDRDELRDAMTTFRDCGFFSRQGSSFYVKTPAANRWLQDRLNGEDVIDTLAGSMSNGETAPESPPF
jgi:hypothetical protein